ncbi:MAG: cardiolipin synthase [Pseudomonadales bacterium]|nr:cardiolipin synthase [Pseudomonadales bacterium]
MAFEVYLLAELAIAFHLLGLMAICHVVMVGRTSESTIAWVMAMLTFPYISLPMYLIFGRKRFRGYIKARRAGGLRMKGLAREIASYQANFAQANHMQLAKVKVVERLASMPFTANNCFHLLINGEQTFKQIFAAIDAAQDYVLVQFFIVKDDALGLKLRDLLIKKADQGLNIYFIYDEIGSVMLSGSFLRRLRKSGVQVSAFNTSKGFFNRLQINFRNHRKLVICDGYKAFIGGHNVGNEYLSLNTKMGFWRDTHCEIQGPAVLCAQLGFIEDWFWATEQQLKLNWQHKKLMDCAAQGGSDVLILPTGPADYRENCSLFFIRVINAAQHRLWITSPYFVPNREVMAALILAALRGVDVRIMLPDKPDHLLIHLSSYTFFKECIRAGIGIYRYQAGFMHQKVILLDNHTAVVGSANLDNRSFRLNFEISAMVIDETVAQQVELMLEEDFIYCRKVALQEFDRKPFYFKLAARLARLSAPLQ